MATTSWFCDTCCDLIESAEDGWVEWVDCPRNDDGTRSMGHSIRIVHHITQSPQVRSCQFKPVHGSEVIGDDQLNMFQGADGLMRLLEMIATSRQPVPAVLEIIKRIHIPGYEHARQHFNTAVNGGVIEGSVTPGYYHQEQIQRVLEWYNESHEDHS